MKVFNCILGILTVLASIYCIFYPGLTFLNIGWIVTIILGLWGISSIVSYAASRNDGNNKEKALMGTLGLIAGIAAAVVSVLAMFMPGIRVMFDILILAIFAVSLRKLFFIIINLFSKIRYIVDKQRFIRRRFNSV